MNRLHEEVGLQHPEVRVEGIVGGITPDPASGHERFDATRKKSIPMRSKRLPRLSDNINIHAGLLDKLTLVVLDDDWWASVIVTSDDDYSTTSCEGVVNFLPGFSEMFNTRFAADLITVLYGKLRRILES